jgi:hypothetical protein
MYGTSSLKERHEVHRVTIRITTTPSDMPHLFTTKPGVSLHATTSLPSA